MSKKYTIPEAEEPKMVGEPAVAYTANAAPVFTRYQMQILDSISHVNDEEEMRDIRNLIAEYFSNKALDAMDKLCDEGKLSTQTIESWSNEHLQTPYVY